MGFEAGKFSQKSYDQNDSYAKKLFKKFLIEKRGHKIISDKENYDHDIISEKNGETYYFELEMKRNYPFTTRESFQFPTVSFLARKERLHRKKPFNYIVICYETNYFISCDSNKIYKNEYIEDRNLQHRVRKGHDKFFRVPKSECYFKKL
jgi:hypothetical protein